MERNKTSGSPLSISGSAGCFYYVLFFDRKSGKKQTVVSSKINDTPEPDRQQ